MKSEQTMNVNKEEVRKIVISTSYGPWHITTRELRAFLEFKLGTKEASKYFFYETVLKSNNFGVDTYLVKMKLKDVLSNCDIHKEYYVSYGDKGNRILIEESCFMGNDEFIYPPSLLGSRFDETLIQFIEENRVQYKKDMDFKDIFLYDLKVVYVPKDVEFEIDDYDGVESVVEKHRRWS